MQPQHAGRSLLLQQKRRRRRQKRQQQAHQAAAINDNTSGANDANDDDIVDDSSTEGDSISDTNNLDTTTTTTTTTTGNSQNENKNDGDKEEEEKFDWLEHWYPLAPVQDLNLDRPNKLTLLGMDLVVWFHEPSQQWRAFTDECPHRLVPLSEGRIEKNDGGCVLQCAYHGWEFNQDGTCTRIPQLGPSLATSSPAVVANPRACATSFPVRVQQGLVWVFPSASRDDDDLLPPISSSLIPELDQSDDFVDATNMFVRDMPYSWEILVENLCDPTHVSFAHHSYMNGADRTMEDQQLDLRIVEESVTGFRAEKDPYPINGGMYNVTFQPPCLLIYTIKQEEENESSSSSSDDNNKNNPYKKGGTTLRLGSYCIPTAPGHCRLIARFPFQLNSRIAMFFIRNTPRWITHLSQNIVMDSDVVFLCSQDERLNHETNRVSPNYYMPARCDTMVSAFRRWLKQYGKGGPMWLTTKTTSSSSSSELPYAQRSNGEPLGWIRPRHIPQRYGRDALLDRYRQHTDICSSCRRVHRILYILREVCVYVAALSTIGLATTRSTGGGGQWIQNRRFLGTLLAVALVVPRMALTPLIARLECVPWPRRNWVSSEPKKQKKDQILEK